MMFVKLLWVLLLQELEKHHNFICLMHFHYFRLKYYTLLKVKFTLDSNAMFFCYFASRQCLGLKFEVWEIWYRCYSLLATICNFLQTKIISPRPGNRSLHNLWKRKWNLAFQKVIEECCIMGFAHFVLGLKLGLLQS